MPTPRTRAEREYQTQVEDQALVAGLQARARATALSREHTPEQAPLIKRRAVDLSVPFAFAATMGDDAVDEIRARQAADTVKAAPRLVRPLSDPYISTIADGDSKEMVRTSRAAQAVPQRRGYPVIDGFKALFGLDGGDSVRQRTPTEQAAFEKEQGRLPGVFAQGFRELGVGVTANIADLYAKAFEALGIDPTAAQTVGAVSRLRGTQELRRGGEMMPAEGGPIKRGVFSGVRSLPGSLIGLGVAAAAGPLAGAGFIGANTQGRSYVEGRNQGLGVGAATAYAATDTAIEIATEYVPFARLLNDTPVGSTLGKRLLRNLVDEQIGEQAATALQDLNAWAALPENSEKTFNDYLAERPDAAVQTAIATLVSSGATNTVVAALDKVSRTVAKARSGEQDAVTLDTIMDSATKHKMRERDPEAFAEYIDSQTEGTGAENVYLPIEAIDTLFQSENIDEDTAAFFESYADQIEEARATGGDVVIPTSILAAKLAGTPVWEALKQDARLDAGGFSPRELETEQKNAETILEQRGEEIAGAALTEIEGAAPGQAVYTDVKQKLRDAGFTESAANQQALLYKSEAETMAADYTAEGTPMTALDWYNANPIEINRADLAPAAPDAKVFKQIEDGFWHGSPSGDLRGGGTGLHLGTKEAARQALEARIGTPADGSDWDGVKVYGETLLAGKATQRKLEEQGRNVGTGYNADAPEQDYYARDQKRMPNLSGELLVAPNMVPTLGRFRLRGPMTNSAYDPRGDNQANGLMKRSLRSGNAKRGFYYRNDSEDEGSISVVVPGPEHLEPYADVTMNQASRYNDRFGDQPLTVADRFGDPSTLMQHDDWAMLTAENPRGEQASELENARAMRDLEADLQGMGLVYTRAVGKYGQIENSFAVVGITQAEAEMLGRKYDQDSVLTRAGLTYQDGSVNPATGSVDVFEERPDDFFTEIPELGVQFAVGIDFDHKVAPVSAETVKVLALDAVSLETRKKIWADIESKNIRLAADGTLLVGVGKTYLTDERYQERLAPYGARAVLESAPEFEAATPTQFDAPPVNADGTITLQHFSTDGSLRVTDPTRWGASGNFLPRSERAKIGSAPPRTYFGIASEQPGGYINEFGDSRYRYEAKIDASLLYDITADSQGLNKNDGNFESAVAEAGYAGYWTQDLSLGLVAVVFDPVEVAPAVKVLFQSENPIFYSALARAIENSKQAKAPASQWKGVLQNAPGVKAEELEWSGLLEMLDFDPKAVFTKEELAAAVEAGGIKIEERELSSQFTEELYGMFSAEDNQYGVWNGEEYVAWFDTAEEADQYIAENPKPAAVQFKTWSSDSSNDTYRELLLTLPIGQGGNPERAPSTHWDQPAVVAHVRFMDKEDVDGNRVLFVEEVQSDWHQKGRDQGYEKEIDQAAVDAALAKYQELAAITDEAAEAARVVLVEETGDPDIIFVEGDARVLRKFVRAQRQANEAYRDAKGEEDTREAAIARLKATAQLHTATQALEGYVSQGMDAELSVATRDVAFLTDDDTAENTIDEALSEWLESDTNKKFIPLWRAYLTARENSALASRELNNARGVDDRGIPNAPFKTSWPALVMKRVIKYAVDGGYDKVAWTTGEQQADRYSLAEATGPLEIRAPFDNTAEKDNGEYLVKMNALAAGRLAENSMGTQTDDYGGGQMTLRMTPAQMTEAFGADITKRAIEGAAAAAEANAPTVQTYLEKRDAAGKAYDDALANELGSNYPSEEADELDALRRAIDFAERDYQSARKDGFILEGEDLKIGGEGMKAFYDRNLVNITNGLVKKAGAKVGPVRIRGENAPAGIETQTGLVASVEQRDANKQQARELIAALGETESPRYLSLVAALGELDALTDEAITEAVKSGDAQPGFEITDTLRDQASAGFPLFQNKDKPRGQVAMYTDRMVITLFEDADPSTLIHETGHVFAERLAREAQKPNAPKRVKGDWAKMRKWLKDNGHNVKGANIPREAHELLARGFERYLMEGRAPSKELESPFKSFRAWLVGVYKNVLALRAPINDEVRGVFDRILATQEAIDTYRDEQNAKPLFADKPADMTQAEFDAYRESVLSSRDEANARLTKKVMEDIRKRENKRYRDRAKDARQDVTEQLNNEPRFVALHLLRTGRWLGDGERATTPMKIDRDWFVSTYGAAALDRLPKGPFLVKKGGDEIDFIAEMTGFPSGAAMVDALFEMGEQQVQMRADGDRRSLFDKETDERVKALLEADGTADPLSPDEMEEEAQAAVENEQQGALLSTELRYLSRGTGQTPTPYRLARVWAERKIRAGTVQAVASRAAVQQYARAAAKAGRLAEEALIVGDTQETYRQKQAQLINHALFMEAKAAADKVDIIVARMRRLGKRAAMKSVDQDYMDRVHGLLEGFDFRKKTAKFLEEQQGFADWAAGQAALGFEVQVPPRLMLNGTPYTRASVEELYGLDDAVKALLHLGKLKQGILDGQAEREFNGLIDEMVDKIADLPDRKLSTEINEEDRPVSGVLSMLIKIETIADDLDGGDPNGPFNRLLTQRVNELENFRTDLRERTLDPISKTYLGLPAAHRRRLEEKVTLPELPHKGGELDPRNGGPTTMTRMELLSVALNTGNLSNLEKMSKGEGWDANTIRDVLNRELTKADWDFVQQIWDSIATLWPDIAATERRLSGVVPEQVEITPVLTPFGEYRGGYYPVVYDPARSQRAENNAVDAANDLFGMKSGVNTPKGHTITRTEASGPILRSVEAVLFNHIEKVITRIAFAEYARDVLRTMDNPRIRNAINLKLGPEYRKQIRPWLQRVVNSASTDLRGLNYAEKFLRAARVNLTLVSMGFRASTAIAQVGGLNQGIGRIGGRYVALGLKTMLRERGKAQAFVFERSPEMERRNGEVNRDVADAMRSMRNKDGWINKARTLAFWHIGMMDRYVVAMPIWLGAHAKGIDEGMTDREASLYADKMVRTSQGSGSTKDLSNWQDPTSEIMRHLTLFYTIFNVQLNAQWESARAVKKGDYMKAVSLTGWFLLAAPLFDALMSGDIPDADDDEDTWANWFGRNVFFNLFSGIPLVRDVAGYGERKMAGEFATVAPSPIRRAEEAIVKAGELGVKAAQGEELPDTTVKTMIETPGYFLGLPTGQAGATGQFLWDYSNGDVDPQTMNDWYWGLTRGKMPEG